MARPRSEGYADQRQQVLAAAAQLFATRGYTATTMNEVAAACGLSKPTLYHYVRDKHDLLAQIASDHVAGLEALQASVAALALPPQQHLREMVQRFLSVYASAGAQHRVLTEDVKFLADVPRQAVLAAQRRVVHGFALAVLAVRPDLRGASLGTPLAMLLLGMMNWTFTWMKPGGVLDYDSLASIVNDLFFGGIGTVAPSSSISPSAGTSDNVR